MTKAEIIKYSVFALIAIAVIILVISLFTSYRNKGTDTNLELIKAKDETIKAIEGQRDILKELIAEKNKELDQHYKQDSILATQSRQLTVKYEKIPVYIYSLGKDSLRAAVWNY